MRAARGRESTPVAKIGTYRAKAVENVGFDRLEKLGDEIIVGIDVAKTNQFVCFGSATSDEAVLGKWAHPAETRGFYGLCTRLKASGRRVVVVMEPSGTYGDPFLHWFQVNGFETRRVLGKQVHDGAAAFDGVMSGHDAKASVMLVRLHRMGASKPWSARPEPTVRLRALDKRLSWYDDECRRLQGMLEAALARHWPEVTTFVGVGKVSLWRLMSDYSSPASVAVAPEGAAAQLCRRGRFSLRVLLRSIQSPGGARRHPAQRTTTS